MGGLEGEALQDAFGFAPGSGGFAARTRRKKETSRGPAAPHPHLASLPSVSFVLIWHIWWGAGATLGTLWVWAPRRPRTPTSGEVWRSPGTLWVPPPDLPRKNVPCL